MTIEQRIIEYLNTVQDVPARGQYPTQSEQYTLVVQKTGSLRKDMIDTAIIRVKCYAPSQSEASSFNEVVKTCMFALPETDNSVSSVKLNSDSELIDTARKRNCYQSTFSVVYF